MRWLARIDPTRAVIIAAVWPRVRRPGMARVTYHLQRAGRPMALAIAICRGVKLTNTLRDAPAAGANVTALIP